MSPSQLIETLLSDSPERSPPGSLPVPIFSLPPCSHLLTSPLPQVWDITAGACSCELVPEVGVAVRSLSVAPDSSLLVAGNSAGTCYVWRTRQGSASSFVTHFEPLHKLKAHQGYLLKALISPDVRTLATTSSDKTLKLWNLDDFSLNKTLEGHQVSRAPRLLLELISHVSSSRHVLLAIRLSSLLDA